MTGVTREGSAIAFALFGMTVFAVAILIASGVSRAADGGVAIPEGGAADVGADVPFPPGRTVNLVGPTAATVNVAPPAPPAFVPVTAATVTLGPIQFDSIQKIMIVQYGNGQATRVAQGSVSQQVVNDVIAAAQAIVEADQGWDAGSSTAH